MAYSLFPSPTVYLIDTSSVVRLDGKDGVPAADGFSEDERENIWEGLEQFARDGRIKMIKQVKSELWRHDRKGRARLCNYPQVPLTIRRTPQVVRLYQTVTTNHGAVGMTHPYRLSSSGSREI